MKCKQIILGIIMALTFLAGNVNKVSAETQPVTLWDHFEETNYGADYHVRQDGSVVNWSREYDYNPEQMIYNLKILVDGTIQQKSEFIIPYRQPKKVDYIVTQSGKEYIYAVASDGNLEYLLVYNFKGEKLLDQELGDMGTFSYFTFIDRFGNFHINDQGKSFKINMETLSLETTPLSNGGYISDAFIMEDGNTVFSNSSGVKRINHAEKILWTQQNIKHGHITTSSNGSLYVISTDYNAPFKQDEYGEKVYTANVYKLNSQTGNIEWQSILNYIPYESSMIEYSWFTSAEETGNSAYISTNEKIYLIDQISGEVKNIYEMPHKEYIEQVIYSNSLVYVIEMDKIIILNENLEFVKEVEFQFISDIFKASDGDIYVLDESEALENMQLFVIKNSSVYPINFNNNTTKIGTSISWKNFIGRGHGETILYNRNQVIGFDINEKQTFIYQLNPMCRIDYIIKEEQTNNLYIKYFGNGGEGLQKITLDETDNLYQPVDPMKSWTITFNQGVDFNTATSQNISVFNEKAEKVNIEITAATPNKLIIKAPVGGYQKGKYELKIGEGVVSLNGKPLKQSKTHFFLVK